MWDLRGTESLKVDGTGGPALASLVMVITNVVREVHCPVYPAPQKPTSRSHAKKKERYLKSDNPEMEKISFRCMFFRASLLLSSDELSDLIAYEACDGPASQQAFSTNDIC